MTKKRKKQIQVEDPTAALRKAVKRLDKDQGGVARRNARSEVLAEMRRLRNFIDREFPILRTRKPRPRKRKTGLDLVNHLLQTGWVQAHNPTRIARAAEAGIKSKLVKVKDDGKRETTFTLLPEWVVELEDHPDFSVAMLKRARRSKQFRDIVLMETVFHKNNQAKNASH